MTHQRPANLEIPYHISSKAVPHNHNKTKENPNNLRLSWMSFLKRCFQQLVLSFESLSIPYPSSFTSDKHKSLICKRYNYHKEIVLNDLLGQFEKRFIVYRSLSHIHSPVMCTWILIGMMFFALGSVTHLPLADEYQP